MASGLILKNRMEDTDAEFLFYCCSAPLCGKTYPSRLSLKRHIDVTHLKKKQIACPQCGKHFATMPNLREHLNLHTGKRPFLCQLCTRRFRQASQLSLHKREHVLGIIHPQRPREPDSEASIMRIVREVQTRDQTLLPLPPLLQNLKPST
jgi:uncharacterized C2H2 Zn-finger protein